MQPTIQEKFSLTMAVGGLVGWETGMVRVGWSVAVKVAWTELWVKCSELAPC